MPCITMLCRLEGCPLLAHACLHACVLLPLAVPRQRSTLLGPRGGISHNLNMIMAARGAGAGRMKEPDCRVRAGSCGGVTGVRLKELPLERREGGRGGLQAWPCEAEQESSCAISCVRCTCAHIAHACMPHVQQPGPVTGGDVARACQGGGAAHQPCAPQHAQHA